MKKFKLVIVFVILATNSTIAQTEKSFKIKFSDLKDTIFLSFGEDEKSIMENYPSIKFYIEIYNIPAGQKISISPGFIQNLQERTNDTIKYDITNELRGGISRFKDKALFKVKKNETVIGNIKIHWTKRNETGSPENNKSEVDQKSIENKQRIINSFYSNSSFANPYDSNKDKVDLFFDENGKLLNSLPVNVDQNDIFFLHILCVKGDEQKYRVNIIEGIYAPIDLAIRPYETVSRTVANATIKIFPIDYGYTDLKAGPFTSDNFKFQISYDSSNLKTYNGPIYSLKINKLYHLGIGVSLISTNLSNPNFKTINNGTDTTIQSFNSGSHTLVTFNVIWYWSILQQNPKGSLITNGRDVLKDEPTISLKRLYPTIGVSLDNNFRENFFGGVVYEFARGGSFIFGVHYGKVNQLADKNFQLGISKFQGTDSDIKVDQVYKTAIFFGITLDTRIFNILTGSSGK